MNEFFHFFQGFDGIPFLVIGWTLFGASKENITNTKTDNFNYDITDASTKNETYAPVTNTSRVSTDSRIANTALQLTDAFNRFNTLNLANVGNTNIGGTSADDAAAYAKLFNAFPQAPRGLNDADPNAWNSGIDFAAISRIATENIKATGEVSKGVLDGFSKVTDAAKGSTASATSSLVKWGIVGAIIITALFLFVRRKK